MRGTPGRVRGICELPWSAGVSPAFFLGSFSVPPWAEAHDHGELKLAPAL